MLSRPIIDVTSNENMPNAKKRSPTIDEARAGVNKWKKIAKNAKSAKERNDVSNM